MTRRCQRLADLVTSLASLLAVADFEVGCCQVEIAGLLDVSGRLLLLAAELVIMLDQLDALLVLLESPRPPAPHT